LDFVFFFGGEFQIGVFRGMRRGNFSGKVSPGPPSKAFGADTEGLFVEIVCKGIFSYGFEGKGFFF
jgi:hypothetical protein